MKITEYIETKRQYFTPKVKIIDLMAEGVLAAATAGATTGGMGNGDTPDPTNPPTNPRLSKGITFIDFDDTEDY